MTNELRYVGELDLTKTQKVRIQDPCYVKEDGSSYSHYEVDLAEYGWLPGDYPVFVELTDETHGWGTRVKRFILGKTEARIKDRYDCAFTWLADLGVDSSQMAFMVESVFHEGWNNDYDDEESDYKQICNLTLGGGEGILDNKLVAASSSGYGDGQYELTCDFERTVFVVTFIEDEDEDDYYADMTKEGEWSFLPLEQGDEFDEWLGVGF